MQCPTSSVEGLQGHERKEKREPNRTSKAIAHATMGKDDLKKMPEKLTDSEKKKIKNENKVSLQSLVLCPVPLLCRMPRARGKGMLQGARCRGVDHASALAGGHSWRTRTHGSALRRSREKGLKRSWCCVMKNPY